MVGGALHGRRECKSYPLRKSACATQRALYKELSRDPETIPYRLPMLLINVSAWVHNQELTVDSS